VKIDALVRGGLAEAGEFYHHTLMTLTAASAASDGTGMVA
jgi:hypothetical protein